MNCSNQPVTNGNVLVYFEGHLYNRPVNNGSFSVIITRCSNSAGSIEVVAVDNVANQQSSSPWTGSASTGTVNTGTISACGTSSVSFIDYTVDGSNYILSSATPGDSITHYGSGSGGTNQTATGVTGFRAGQPNVHISFATQGAAVGTFTLNYLAVNQFDTLVTLVVPFNINFTTYGAPGQFIEGNFTGQFRDVSNVVHNISATFRVRRKN